LRTMTGEDLIRLATENVEAWSLGDWERLKAPFSSDVVYLELGTQRTLRGLDQLVETYKSWKLSIPDGTGRVVSSLASGNTVVLEVIWSGTQTGPIQTPGGVVPASGKSFTLAAAQVITFRDGKIIEFRHYFDMLTMLQQIGAVPKPAGAETKEEIAAGM